MAERLIRIVLPAAVCTLPAAGWAVQYLSLEQAQRSAFAAADRFVPTPLKLTEQQAEAVATAAGVRVRDPQLRAWVALKDNRILGHLLLDEVLGKHELITYALAVDPAGNVLGLEILDYRETYGGEIRDSQWRSQFTGRSTRSPLKLDEDIRNISGAILSCRHVTDGVRRLLATHAILLRKN